MDLRSFLHLLRRRWLTIAATVAVTIAAAAIVTIVATPMYESTARLFVSTAQSDTSDAYQGGLLSEQRVSSYATLVKSREVAANVIKELDLDESETELLSRVSARVVPDTVILELSVTDPDPQEARRLAQTYAEEVTDVVRGLETPDGSTNSPIKATIIDPASLPTDAVSPEPLRNLVLALVLGLVLGAAIAVLREVLDTSIKSLEDIAVATPAAVLGMIAYDPSAAKTPLISSLDSHAPRVEAFRVLRTNLQFVDVDRQNKLFVVTSALPEEGKTATAVNLALALADAGRKTLLIECDLRRPRAAERFGIDGAIGVTTALVGKVSACDAIQRLEGTQLSVLPSGAIPPNPAELLQSRAMKDLLAEVRSEFEVVIVDTPPLLPVTDAALVAAQADGALLVVRYGKTTKDQLAGAVDRLRQVDARTVGVVLSMTPSKKSGSGYGYGYGYGPS